MANTYSRTNELKWDFNDDSKYMLYMQFVAWNCNRCPIFQEFPTEKNYFTNADKRVTQAKKKIREDCDITLKINLKAVLTKRM